jgi:hypothetical protein
MSHDPILISEANLSLVWARAFLKTLELPLQNPPPFAITIDGFESNSPIEEARIRNVVDEHLHATGKNSVHASAFVIFPYSACVHRGRPAADAFFDFCLNRLAPRLRARCQLNKRGMYFERMMKFVGNTDGALQAHNQLAYIINLWRKGREQNWRPPHSRLQVSCIDPFHDHDGNRRPSFPCLQQVSFGYDSDDTESLSITAYYPVQYVFDRGYGNFLGICQLGEFMAHELNLNLVRFTCFVGRMSLGDVRKKQMLELAEDLRDLGVTCDGYHHPV